VGCEDIDWIELAQDRDRWLGISGLADKRLASEEELCSMEYISN